MGTGNKYPGFDYAATELSAYTMSVGIFIISLKNGSLIHSEPKDTVAFEKWLVKHRIRDIRRKEEDNKL